MKKDELEEVKQVVVLFAEKLQQCLQEAPLTAIAENLQYEEKLRKEENHKVRYLGFGIRFQKNFIYKKNGRPVIYDETNRAKEYLPENEWW